VVCFDRIDALHSSTDLHSVRTIPVQNIDVMSAAPVRRFGLFFGQRRSVGTQTRPRFWLHPLSQLQISPAEMVVPIF
jgi:hypothetical protein